MAKKKVQYTAPAVVNIFWPGAGQCMKGEIGKGIGIMAMNFVAILLCFLLIGFILVPIVYIYALYDAYNTQV